jgi:signal transduction histidine kinase
MEVYIPKSRREDAVGRLQNSFALMLQSLNFHIGSTRYLAEQTQHRNDELVEATRKVSEADKRKTTFIQNVTHQIRTPLNIVMGFAQVLRDTFGMTDADDLEDSPISEEELKNITHTMNHNALLLNRLVAMLYDTSELGQTEEMLRAVRSDMVSCNEVASEAIGYIRIHYPDLYIGFESEVDDDFCIRTSHQYLMRSLREILYNAAKYSDRQHVVVRIEKTDSVVRFVIEDTGRGIAEKDRELVFEPFMKIDDLSEGLGLGLPLSKRHIETLGGRLILDTDYHEGCRIIAELPIC